MCALCRLDAWFKSFAEGEHFDCNAACCVLKLGPAAPLKLVNCQDWSVKGGPRVKGVESPTRGVLQEEGWLVTDLLGFEGPLCGLLQQGGPLHKKKRGKAAGSREGAGALAPAARSLGRTPVYPFKSHRPDVPCQGALALNKLSYCKSVIRQGKHGHPTSPTPHTSQIFCPHRLVLVSQRSTPGEGAMSQLLNLPITFQPTQEDGCFSSPLPPTRTLTIENVIHTSRL